MYLDHDTPTYEQATVKARGKRFAPTATPTLTVQLPSGTERTFEVRQKTAELSTVGSSIEVVHSVGALRREWIDEASFHQSLRATIRTTTLMYAGILIGCLLAQHLMLQRVIGSAKIARRAFAAIFLLDLALFYALP